MSTASSTIQIDFGHRTVDITIGDVRSWRPWTDETITAACKALRLKSDVEGARQCAVEIIDDVAAQTAGCESFECISCGCDTYGAEGVIGSECCTECDNMAALDNQCNDEDREPTEDERAWLSEMADTIRANGGNFIQALSTCEYLLELTNTGDKS